MKNTLTTALIALFLATPCLAEEVGLPFQPGDEKYFFLYVKKETPIYETKGYDNPKGKLSIGYSFYIPIEMKDGWNTNKWLHMTNERYPNAPFWIETKDLTSKDQLKKVTKDWPVRYLYASGAECMYYLNFTTNGEVDIAICEDKAKGHVYRDGPIVKIPFMSKKHGLTLVGLSHIDENNKLYADFAAGSIGEYEKQGLFTDPKKTVIGPWGKCLLDCDQPVASKFSHKPHASWISSKLYGNDDEYSKLKRVVISESNKKYDVYIENQYGMKCSVYFDEKGTPALLQNCYLSDGPPNLIIDSIKISLRCNIYGNEEVCNGEYKWHDNTGYSGKSRLTIARRIR